MKVILSYALIVSFLSAGAQETIIQYFDTDWGPTSKERAVYYTTFIKQGDVYKTTTYYVKGNIIQGRSTYADTIMAKPIGERTTYYKSGKLEDSVIYKPDGQIFEAFHYYENEQLGGHFYTIETTKKDVTEGFDENGVKIKNYILGQEAEFKGGDEAWKAYLLKNVRKDILVRGTAQQTVTVLIQFYIDPGGNVSGAKVQKSSGVVLVDKDAVGVVTSSPPWKNAIQYNKPVKVYRLQPITYVLEPMQKKNN